MATRRRRASSQPDNALPLITQCRHCSGFFEPAEGGMRDVCPECAERHYAVCSECGRTVGRYDVVQVEGRGALCSGCAENIAFRCSECGTWHVTISTSHITDRHGNRICESCWEGWTCCERCGGWFRDNEVHVSESDGRELCWRCTAEVDHRGVQNYGYKPTPIFHRAEGEAANSLVLGIELEMDNGDGQTAAARISDEFGSDWLYFKRDGSLVNGVELVTHPISPLVLMSDEGRAMWRRITELAIEEGMRSHDTRTCGLHIHVNRDFFGKGERWQEIAELKLLGIVDRLFEPLKIFSRRRTAELDQWAKRPMLPKSNDGWQQRAKDAHATSRFDRYRAINVQNDATIEFRLFRGTLKPETLLATFQFVSGLCAVAKELTPGQLDRISWYELCDEVIERCPCDAGELEAYLIERELMTPKEVLKCA